MRGLGSVILCFFLPLSPRDDEDAAAVATGRNGIDDGLDDGKRKSNLENIFLCLRKNDHCVALQYSFMLPWAEAFCC